MRKKGKKSKKDKEIVIIKREKDTKGEEVKKRKREIERCRKELLSLKSPAIFLQFRYTINGTRFLTLLARQTIAVFCYDHI